MNLTKDCSPELAYLTGMIEATNILKAKGYLTEEQAWQATGVIDAAKRLSPRSSKAVVLSSGGVDSTTAVGLAVHKHGAENVTTVSVNYNQKHTKELDAADAVAKYYNVGHEVINLSEMYKHSNCSLLKHSTESVPEGSYADQLKDAKHGVSTAVPFRNGLMLAAVTAFAQSIYPDEYVTIYLGNHADDAAGNAYADCSESFSNAIGEAINIGTYHLVDIETPFVKMNKSDVVKLGLEFEVPYHLTTSCYNGEACACGRCGTCLDRIAAFRKNGVIDPIEYEGDDPFADMR